MELDDEIVEEVRAARMTQSSAVRQRVADSILSKTDEEVTSLLMKRSKGASPWQDVLEYVKALFYGLRTNAKEDDSSRSAKLLVSTFINVIDLFNSQSLIGNTRLGDCLSFLVQELDGFPKTLLPSISDKIISQLESESHREGVQHDEGSVHHLLEFLPRCLGLIGSAGSVQVVKEDGEVVDTTGMHYRESALKRLASFRWSKKFVTRMASLLRELSLDTREMELFVRKLFIHMKDAEPQDLPSLVYQLLLLASKGFKRVVLTGMINFFNKKHSQENTIKARNSSVHALRLKSSADAFRQMEGTIVLHINFAVKQDPALGQEWLYLVRTNSWPLTPFLVSVLLSIGRIQRFEQPAFDLLRVAAVKSFKDCQQCRDSRWAASILGALSLQISKKVEDSFMRTVHSSTFGWDHIIPSVVRMGFCLIESSGPGRPKGCVGRTSSSVSSTQELGIRVLSAAFEAHEMSRDEIIEQSKCRIIGLKPQHSAPILRVIVELVQNCPQLLLEHSARLKECLDYFTCLHSFSASSLVQAISPLFQLSRDLQDYTVLVLRKAMFGREESARVTAVCGLVDLIISEKRARSIDSESARPRWSEASCSQSSQFDHSSVRAGSLLQDLLGLLRRCLSQQLSVRETLYQGLPKLLLADPEASEAVFDLIWPHFNRFFVSESDNTASLKLDLCVMVQNDGVRVVEPLDHLLYCIHQLMLLRPQVGTESAHSYTNLGLSERQDHDHEVSVQLSTLSAGESLARAFQNLRKIISISSLGDFYRHKTLNFCSDTSEGEKNLEQARLLMGVVEVFLDSAVLDCVNRDSEERRKVAEKELCSYLDLYDSLTQIVHQKQGKTNAKGTEKKDLEKKRREKPPNGPKSARGRGKAAQNKEPSTQPGVKTGTLLPSRTLYDKRNSFLSSASIVYLLNSYATQMQSKRSEGGCDRQPEEQAADPPVRPTGASHSEGTKGNERRIATFALQNCFRYLKAMDNESLGQTDALEVTCGDWTVLSMPVFQVVVASKDSITDPGPATQDASKETKKVGKGKKAEGEVGEGLMLTSLKCLEELLRVASQRRCLPEVVKQMDLDPDDIVEDNEDHESDEELITPGESTENIFEKSDAKLVHRWLTKQCHPLLEELLSQSRYPEIEVFSGIIQNLGTKLPQVLMTKHGLWARLVFKGKNIRHVGAARGLATMALSLSPSPDDVSFAQVLAIELLKVTGSDTREAMDSSDQYPIINKGSRTAIGGLLLHKTDRTLVDMEWLASKLKIQASSEIPQLDRKTPLRPAGSQRMLMEESLHTRMESTVLLLSVFTTMTLNGGLAEQLMRATMHFYKCFAVATRLLIAPRGVTQPVPSPLFQKLAEMICKRLTASVYSFVSAMQRDQQEGAAQGKGSVSQIKREGRTIPNLIFHIEETERHLLKLSKNSKVNLLRSAKRSTARDFRISDNATGKKRKAKAQAEAQHDGEDLAQEGDEEREIDEGMVREAGEEEEQQEEEEAQQGEEEQQDEEEAPHGEEEEQQDEEEAQQDEEVAQQDEDVPEEDEEMPERDEEVPEEDEEILEQDEEMPDQDAEEQEHDEDVMHIAADSDGEVPAGEDDARISGNHQRARSRIILDSDDDSDGELAPRD